jgi:hypothetical protein
MRATFIELKKKYLELCEKAEDGEEMSDEEEYALYSIYALRSIGGRNMKFTVKMFFDALERLLIAEDL